MVVVDRPKIVPYSARSTVVVCIISAFADRCMPLCVLFGQFPGSLLGAPVCMRERFVLFVRVIAGVSCARASPIPSVHHLLGCRPEKATRYHSVCFHLSSRFPGEAVKLCEGAVL